jgi:hypothetical protein
VVTPPRFQNGATRGKVSAKHSDTTLFDERIVEQDE